MAERKYTLLYQYCIYVPQDSSLANKYGGWGWIEVGLTRDEALALQQQGILFRPPVPVKSE